MLNKLAADIHADNLKAGWWEPFPVKMDRYNTAMMLTVTEVAEAAEGVRKDLMDDKLTARTMVEVELADTLIRLLDLCGAYDVPLNDLDEAKQVARSDIEESYDLNNLEPLFYICRCVCLPSLDYQRVLRHSVAATIALSEFWAFDVFAVVEEKRAFNAVRDDHKPENRAKKGGKKF